MKSKKTVVIGATTDASRYANMACHMLDNAGFEFVPIGIKRGEILGKTILDLRQKPVVPDVHTVSLYIGPANQAEWFEYILGLNPERIIFNPGTENPVFEKMAEERGIHVAEECNLVLLRTGQF